MNTPNRRNSASATQTAETGSSRPCAIASSANAKIFIITHTSAAFLSDDDGVYEPLHVGRAVMDEPSKDLGRPHEGHRNACLSLTGDNTGDNISYLNRYLNELTGHYWVWKNFDLASVEFVGFCHYRRYFLFDQSGRRPVTRWRSLGQWRSASPSALTV